MKPRIIFVHGNQTRRWSNNPWVPWLKSQLNDIGFSTVFETMPDSIIARAEYWLPFLSDELTVGNSDVLIGYSSGATAALRYAETYKIRGSVLISPCYTDLDDDFEKQSGYYDQPWDWDSIKANQKEIVLFCGSNDPFIPQEEFGYISEQLGCEMHNISGEEHFIDRAEFPEVLEYLKAQYA